MDLQQERPILVPLVILQPGTDLDVTRERIWMRLDFSAVSNRDSKPGADGRRDSRRTRLGLPLGAGQVDEVQLPPSDVLLPVHDRHHLERDREDGVGAGGVRVHQRRPRRPVLPALVHQGLALPDVVHGVGAQVCEGISCRALPGPFRFSA